MWMSTFYSLTVLCFQLTTRLIASGQCQIDSTSFFRTATQELPIQVCCIISKPYHYYLFIYAFLLASFSIIQADMCHIDVMLFLVSDLKALREVLLIQEADLQGISANKFGDADAVGPWMSGQVLATENLNCQLKRNHQLNFSCQSRQKPLNAFEIMYLVLPPAFWQSYYETWLLQICQAGANCTGNIPGRMELGTPHTLTLQHLISTNRLQPILTRTLNMPYNRIHLQGSKLGKT